jgi:hypothetical protein
VLLRRRVQVVTRAQDRTAPESDEVIEIPIFKEIPARRADYDATILVEQVAQQQQ